jgi:hypothetical protein
MVAAMELWSRRQAFPVITGTANGGVERVRGRAAAAVMNVVVVIRGHPLSR